MPNLFCLIIYLFLCSYCNSAKRKADKPYKIYCIDSFKSRVLAFLDTWYKSDKCTLKSSISNVNHFKLFIYDLRSSEFFEHAYERELFNGFIEILADIDNLPKM